MSEPRIVSAEVGPQPKQVGDPMPTVTVTFDDGTSKELFSYFPDEIEFKSIDFIGCTLDQAIRLKFIKDRNYLRTAE